MAAWKSFLENEGFEKLAEAKHCTDVLAKDDPETEPYRSLYKAREHYKAVQKVLKKTSDRRDTDEDFDFTWAALEFRLGVNYMNTEETAAGEEHVQKCLDKLEDYKMSQKGMGIYQEAINQIGILWAGRNKPTEALEQFKKAELLYVDFKNEVGGAPWMVEEFLSPPREDVDKLEYERNKKLESNYTHTLFYFAQVYQQLGEKGTAAEYCHLTLQRQLDSQDMDQLDWSLHAATLSQYYMSERDFTMSRHCLASAEVMFEQAQANNMNMSDELKEKYQQAEADLQRCWIKYGLGLLEHSRELLLEETAEMSNETSSESGSSETRASETENGDDKEKQEVKDEQRFNLEVTSHEEKVTDKALKGFDDARVIFLLLKKWIDHAKDFYKLNDHCPDYVAIIQDHSLSFKFLSFFEVDMERQCKMHKRRIDMLVEVLNELSIQHYLLICRQLMFEIADTYSVMLDLKMAVIEASGGQVRPTPHSMKKINALASDSIKYYQEYLNTLKGGKPVYPDEFPENDVRPGLIAMFCMGRLYSKFLSPQIQGRLMNIKKSKDCYQFVVDYCRRNPSAQVLVEAELELCKELVQLLPKKMEKLRMESEM